MSNKAAKVSIEVLYLIVSQQLIRDKRVRAPQIMWNNKFDQGACRMLVTNDEAVKLQLSLYGRHHPFLHYANSSYNWR